MILTTFTWATVYIRTIVKTVIANLKTKLWDMSHNIHRKRTANNNISITEIQINAVKNNNNKIIVLGKTVACNTPRRTRSSKAHTNDELYPTSKSS